MDIIRGCECTKSCGIHGPDNDAPCFAIVERNGVTIRICTRCQLSSDKKVALLVDAETAAQPFQDYDILGYFCLLHYLIEGFGDSPMKES